MSFVLLSWVAIQNDPFERERDRKYRVVNGEKTFGPTLTLLFDEESEYKEKISEIVFFYRESSQSGGIVDKEVLNETKAEIEKRNKNIKIKTVPWKWEDPTDYEAIFQFLNQKIPELRIKYPHKKFVVHVSPGTPAMQTIWILMGETGFIEPPFVLVKSYRKIERKAGKAVIPVELGIDSFYKRYKSSQPKQKVSEEDLVVWDLRKFNSNRLKELYVEARRFSQLNIPLIILGERGTGKTTLASWIRLNSPFHKPELDQSWPAVACGQYNSETMRAELFGYKKGAFTGANSDKEGLLHSANGDTLFLDEIGDISKDLQRLLIKAIEEKQYQPLGDNKPKKSDFRLITATNQDWRKLQEKVDPDFLDRISLLKLEMPALREIREDLPWLWAEVFQKAVIRARVSSQKINISEKHHQKIINEIKGYDFPGNLRDLFRLAYFLIAQLSDPEEPVGAEKAIDHALAEFSNSIKPRNSWEETLQPLIVDFLESHFSEFIATGKKLAIKEFEKNIKGCLGKELKLLSGTHGVSLGALCDINERTVRNWINETEK